MPVSRGRGNLAGCLADCMQVSSQDLFLASQDIVALQLSDEVLCADALDEHTETLAGLTLLTIEQQSLLDHLEQLFLGVNFVDDGSDALTLTPDTADHDLVADLLFCDAVKVACADALAAVVAQILVDLHQAVIIHEASLHGADIHNAALLAAGAVVHLISGNALTHDTEVIQAGLDAVVGAAANTDLELVGQLDIRPALVEGLVQFASQLLGVDDAVDADSTLAGDDGTDEFCPLTPRALETRGLLDHQDGGPPQTCKLCL